MTSLSRLLVAGWMVAGLLVAMLAVAVPAFALYGVTSWVGPSSLLAWLDVGLPWVLRIALCSAVWLIAKSAARVAGPHGASRTRLAVFAWAGLALGLVAGIAVRDAWGPQVVAALGLPPESFVGDIVSALTLSGYAIGAFVATYVPKKVWDHGSQGAAVEQGVAADER
jgi:hypothetical protein